MPQAAGMRLIDNGNVFASVRPRRERNKFEITRTVPFQGFRSHRNWRHLEIFHHLKGSIRTTLEADYYSVSKHLEVFCYSWRYGRCTTFLSVHAVSLCYDCVKFCVFIIYLLKVYIYLSKDCKKRNNNCSYCKF